MKHSCKICGHHVGEADNKQGGLGSIKACNSYRVLLKLVEWRSQYLPLSVPCRVRLDSAFRCAWFVTWGLEIFWKINFDENVGIHNNLDYKGLNWW